MHRKKSCPINLGKPSLRLRLEAYYSLICPQIIENKEDWKEKFDQIYEKFGGSVEGEAALAEKLAKKYGDTVRLKLTTTDDEATTITNTGVDPNIIVYDELWYTLQPSERNSGVLDFTKNGFDPMTVLSTNPDRVFEANSFINESPILDNLSKCPFLLPLCDPQSRQHLLKNHSAKPASIEKSKPHTVKVPVFSALAAKYENSGPTSFLHQLHMERKRVRVLVRYVDCIRGTLTGYLLAFDKHMNMILRDVDEVYTSRVTRVFVNQDLTKPELEFRRRSCISFSADKEKSKIPSTVAVQQRYASQMMVRGDCVVSVWMAEAERSAYPCTLQSPKYTVDGKEITSCIGTPGSLLLRLQQPLESKSVTRLNRGESGHIHDRNHPSVDSDS